MADYNTQLQSNNADLQAILEVLQNKAAGGGSGGTGGSIEAWTGTIYLTGGLGSAAPSAYYTDASQNICALGDGLYIDETITIAANTAIFVPSYLFEPILTNAEIITSPHDVETYKCTVIRPTSNNFSISA